MVLGAILDSLGSISFPLFFLLGFLTWWLFSGNNNTSEKGKPLPGPRGVPLLGCLPFLGPRLFIAINRMRQKYGDIFEVPIGMQRFVFLNSYEAIKEALVNQADRFSGRFNFDLVTKSTRGCGILFTDGPLWQEHRRFALRVLKDFGLGRPLSEEIVLQEADGLCSHLRSASGGPVDTKFVFSRSVSNVISRLNFGDRSGDEDPHFTEFLQRLDNMVAAGGFATLIPIIFPIVNRYPILQVPVEKLIRIDEHTEWCHDFVKRKITDHRKRIEEDGVASSLDQAQDFCDALLLERQRLETAGTPHTFKEWQLIRGLFELFVAGTDTTAVTLCWACALLSQRPEVQVRVQEELDEVIGSERSPSMADRRQCHVTNAVIDEVLRVSTLAPFALPHRSTEDSVVNGFFIPKDRLIMPNLFAVHHDPTLWKDPDTFMPDRFLQDGIYKSSEHMIAFGLGKRACLGESLARMELFLFFVTIMQKFSVRLHEPDKVDLDRLRLGEDGTVRHLCKHAIIFEPRKKDCEGMASK